MYTYVKTSCCTLYTIWFVNYNSIKLGKEVQKVVQKVIRDNLQKGWESLKSDFHQQYWNRERKMSMFNMLRKRILNPEFYSYSKHLPNSVVKKERFKAYFNDSKIDHPQILCANRQRSSSTKRRQWNPRKKKWTYI